MTLWHWWSKCQECAKLPLLDTCRSVCHHLCHHFTAWLAGMKYCEYFCPQICLTGYQGQTRWTCPTYLKDTVIFWDKLHQVKAYHSICCWLNSMWLLHYSCYGKHSVIIYLCSISTLLYFTREIHLVSILLARKYSVYINKTNSQTISYLSVRCHMIYSISRLLSRTNSGADARFL